MKGEVDTTENLAAPAVDYVISWELPEKASVARKLWRYYEPIHEQGRLVLFKVKDTYREPPDGPMEAGR